MAAHDEETPLTSAELSAALRPPEPADRDATAGYLAELDRRGPLDPAEERELVLIAEQPPTAEMPAADGSRPYDAARRPAVIRRRRQFDRVPGAVNLDHERRVVEVAARTAPAGRLQDLVHDAVEADGVPACPERD